MKNHSEIYNIYYKNYNLHKKDFIFVLIKSNYTL